MCRQQHPLQKQYIPARPDGQPPCRAADDVAYSETLTGAHFLEPLRERLALLDELLACNGSIYVHIDYKIGHYVKVIMDEIFGAKNFRSDITRWWKELCPLADGTKGTRVKSREFGKLASPPPWGELNDPGD